MNLTELLVRYVRAAGCTQRVRNDLAITSATLLLINNTFVNRIIGEQMYFYIHVAREWYFRFQLRFRFNNPRTDNSLDDRPYTAAYML